MDTPRDYGPFENAAYLLYLAPWPGRPSALGYVPCTVVTGDEVTAYFQYGIYLAWNGRELVEAPLPSDVLATSCVRAQVFIGSEPDGSTGIDSFDVDVYSPESFALLARTS